MVDIHPVAAAGHFENWLETELREAIDSGTRSYMGLLRRFGDVYPSVLLRGLERLASADQIDVDMVEAIHASARRPCAVVAEPATGSPLPVPHPLDFDWRFSDVALELLASQTRAMDPWRLICLGAPSLFWYVHREAARTVFLLDANAESLRSGAKAPARTEQFQLDVLRDDLPSLRSRAVVADPPWYPEHVRAFLWAARELCEVGGSVWISVPGVGTRPGIEREIADLIGWANGLGLHLVDRSRGALPYRTPAFERNALRAEGIMCVPAQWRRGDLLVFAVVGENAHPRPVACSLEAAEWEEVCMDEVRLRFRVRGHRLGQDERGDPRLHSIVLGDVLPSVSRRDPRRTLAQVWTSGNRVFGCENPALSCEIARATVLRVSAHRRVERYTGRRLHTAEQSRISEAERHLRKLAEIETMEYGEGWRGV